MPQIEITCIWMPVERIFEPVKNSEIQVKLPVFGQHALWASILLFNLAAVSCCMWVSSSQILALRKMCAPDAYQNTTCNAAVVK